MLTFNKNISLNLLDDTEEIDISIIEREVNNDISSSPGDPQSLPELLDDGQGFVPLLPQVLHWSCAAVGGQKAPVTVAFKFHFVLIAPTEMEGEIIGE